MTQRLLGSLLILAFFSACPRKNSSEPYPEDHESLHWDASTVQPKELFQKWRDTQKDPQMVCQGLLALSVQDLMLFESEIFREELNAKILAPCHEELKNRLRAQAESQSSSNDISN